MSNQPTAPDATDEERALSFAATLKQVRSELGMTQEEFAKRIGASTRTVARWESEDKGPSSAAQKAAIVAAIKALAPLGSGSTTALLTHPVLAAVLSPGVSGTVSAVATAVSVARHATKVSSFRRRIEVLEAVESAASDLGANADALGSALAAVLVVAERNGLSVPELVALLTGDSA